ncbi:MAG TPA: twin-arginine translocase TatA/TatE family subunit [Acidimicrobiales bacterium]|nr:twin-arginine translocase TatA/TatE family subunit [Acidimicrobiales bacterium]
MLAMILGPDGLIVVVVAAAVLLFGGAKLPQLARGLGSASHEFKKGIAEGDPPAAEQKSVPAEGTTAPAPDGAHFPA